MAHTCDEECPCNCDHCRDSRRAQGMDPYSTVPTDDGEDDVIYGGRTEDFDWVPDASV